MNIQIRFISSLEKVFCDRPFDEWVGLIDEFVDCIRNHKQPKINLKWHRQTIACMNACYASIQNGQPAGI